MLSYSASRRWVTRRSGAPVLVLQGVAQYADSLYDAIGDHRSMHRPTP